MVRPLDKSQRVLTITRSRLLARVCSGPEFFEKELVEVQGDLLIILLFSLFSMTSLGKTHTHTHKKKSKSYIRLRSRLLINMTNDVKFLCY